MKLIIILIVAITLNSCVEIIGSGQLERVDALRDSCDSLTEQLLLTDISNADEIKEWMDRTHLKIRQIETAVEMELAVEIDRFRQFRNYVPVHDSLGKSIHLALTNEMSNLEKLHSDIEHGSGDRKRYEAYIAFESAKIDTIRHSISDRDTIRQKIMTIFNDLHGSLDSNLSVILSEV